MSEPLSAEELAAIKAKVEHAYTEIGEVCSQGVSKRFRMHIPADPDQDTDLIITAALSGAEVALAEVERLHHGMRDLYARWVQRARDSGDYYNRTAAHYEYGKAVAFDAAAEEISSLVGEEFVKVATESAQAEPQDGESR